MGDLQPGRDCVITAKFPLKRLNQVEIEKANNLGELKEQLLIRNNSHYKNAEFRVLVPKTFDLDVETAAGPIMCQDIDGSLKATTKGGSVEIGNVTETATIFTEGGAIVAGNFGADAKLFTQGGQIEVGDVKGELEVETYGGQIAIGHVQGQLKASTRGGRIRIDESEGHVEATSQGGQIDIYKAHESVVATTMNGALKVNFVDTPTKPVKLTCPTGSIKIGYAPGFAAKISATSSLSRVSAPFLEGNAKHIEFQLKGGETKMDVVSNTGSIKFREIDVDDLDRDLESLRQQRKELKASRIAQKVFNRAYDIHMQGRIEEAVEAHKEAAKHEDFKGIATYNLGCAYALLGKTDMALDALDQSLEYGFWDRDYWETDEDLDSLRELDRFKELLNKVREKTSASISTRDNCCSGA